MSDTTTASRGGSLSIDRLLGVVLERQTYKNLVYLVLAFPVGLIYWMALGFGFVFGLVLLVVGVGAVVLIFTLAGTRLCARLERWLANALLRVDLVDPDDRPPADGAWSTCKSIVDAPSTWRGLGFVTVKFWVGVLGLLVFFFLWNALELVTAPLRYPVDVEFGTVNDEPVGWTIGTLPEAMVAVPLGLAVGIFLLHVSNGFAYVSERMAVALLGEETPSPSTTDPDPP